MKAISKQPKPYILKADRGLKEEEQTVFWIKPKTARDVNEAMNSYGPAIKETPEGYKEYNTNKLNEADKKEWQRVVTKVENFAFTNDYIESNPELKERIKAKEDDVSYVEFVDELHYIGQIWESMSPTDIGEVMKASQDMTFLKEGEKNV